MLEREQAVVSKRCRVRVAEYTEEPALVLRKRSGVVPLVDVEFVWGRNHKR